MNLILVCGRRIVVLAASVFILLVSFVASASAQDIAVTKFTTSAIVAVDTDVQYEVTVSNSTGSTGSTMLTDTVPANMTFVSAVVAHGWNCTLPAAGSGGIISCTYPSDMPDESVFSFFFVFHVAPGTPSGTEIINTANITNEADNNSANDSSSAMVTVGEPPPPPPPPLQPKDVLISEFRLSGPGGIDDEYIEFYCNRDVDCDVSFARLRAHDPNGTEESGDLLFTLPDQLVIPARQYMLIGDSAGFSLFSYSSIDVDMDGFPDFWDNEGFQLVAGEEGAVIDSVGFTGGGNAAQYIEGAGLERASSRPADQYAYVRKRTLETNGLPQDTNNNAEDFVLVSVTGTAHAGITAPPVLGAPGPQCFCSPYSFSNSQVTGTLTDPTKSKEDDPNRVRVGTGDDGTLSIRRSFTNNTNETFGYLGFRVIEISTLNSPNTLGEQAQLRLVSSENTFADVPSRGGSITINGTLLEYDDMCGCAEPQQPNGGGLNSSVSVDSEQFFMAPNDTVDVQFLFNVIKAGFYRFYIYVEAGSIEPVAPVSGNTQSAAASRARVKPTTPRKFLSVQRVSSASSKPKQSTPVLTPVTTTPATPSNVPPPPLPVKNAPTPVSVRNAAGPRLLIINRGIAEGEKKPRKKTRVRRKNSAALKKKAEERFAVEKPQN